MRDGRVNGSTALSAKRRRVWLEILPRQRPRRWRGKISNSSMVKRRAATGGTVAAWREDVLMGVQSFKKGGRLGGYTRGVPDGGSERRGNLLHSRLADLPICGPPVAEKKGPGGDGGLCPAIRDISLPVSRPLGPLLDSRFLSSSLRFFSRPVPVRSCPFL